MCGGLGMFPIYIFIESGFVGECTHVHSVILTCGIYIFDSVDLDNTIFKKKN